jgi:hypothetical protein
MHIRFNFAETPTNTSCNQPTLQGIHRLSKRISTSSVFFFKSIRLQISRTNLIQKRYIFRTWMANDPRAFLRTNNGQDNRLHPSIRYDYGRGTSSPLTFVTSRTGKSFHSRNTPAAHLPPQPQPPLKISCHICQVYHSNAAECWTVLNRHPPILKCGNHSALKNVSTSQLMAGYFTRRGHTAGSFQMDPMSFFNAQGQSMDRSRHLHPRDAKYQATHLPYHS